jgi:hypothetical protein
LKAGRFLNSINKMMTLSLGLVDSPSTTLRYANRGRKTSHSKSRFEILLCFSGERLPRERNALGGGS